MKKIYPCLWFDDQAVEAAEFYTSLFQGSSIDKVMYYMDDEHKPKGSVLTVDFTLAGERFMALNGGPEFIFSPATSLFVDCETIEELEKIWQALSVEGTALMPLQSYPFSEYYGWIQDKYGLSWQLNLAKIPQRISPAFMFANEQFGKAKEAMEFWMSMLPKSYIVEEVVSKGHIQQALFTLSEKSFRVMDSELAHDFDFTMAFSICIDCEDQAEIDFLWEKLTKDGKEGPCGWAEDVYGLSWQITPAKWNELADDQNLERAAAVMQALYGMKKIEIDRLEEVYHQFD